MYRQFSSRNHRSKGIKVKHVLQICLLLAVCFWLIYQVKHSHEKKKEFDKKDEKVVGRVQNNGEIQRIGRKDLPRVTEITTDVEKHPVDEEEREGEEEENKHEEDDLEKEDSSIQDREIEDASRGGGDDEIDENELEKTEAETEHEDEPEKTEAEAEHEDETVKTEAVQERENEPKKPEPELEEEQVDEDKERQDNEGNSEKNHTENEENGDVGKVDLYMEDNEDAGKEDHTEPEEDEDGRKKNHHENDPALPDHDRDRGSKNTREAREEQYKADDASSEVDHDIQTIIPETGNATIGHANELSGKVNFGQENETKTSNKDDAGVQPRDGGVDRTETGTSSNVTVIDLKKHETNSTNSEDSLLQNSTRPILPSKKPENNSNSTAVGADRPVVLLSNGTQTASEASLSQDATVEGTTDIEERILMHNLSEDAYKTKLAVDSKNQSETAAVSNKTESENSLNTNTGESLISSNPTSPSSLNSNGTNTMSARSEKLGNSGTADSDENADNHSSKEGSNGFQHDPIDASDATLTPEEKESRTDLGTLPEIRTEVQNIDDTMAE